MRLQKAICAAALAVGGILAPAAAEMKTSLNAAEIEALLTDAGLPVEMVEDAKTGAPVAQGSLGSLIFIVRGMDCSGRPMSCGTLLFFANFELGAAATPANYEAVNSFNDKQLYGRAYVVPGRNQVGVDYVVELDGGVSTDNLARNLERWADVVGAFVAHMSGGEGTATS
jgi:hypothetical protein